MNKPPKITNIKQAASSRLFTIEQVDLQFENGTECQYERIKGRRGHAVLIVPMLDDGSVLLGREYQVGVENYELGVIKGLIDEGESMLEAANRELQEELGYAANNLHEICEMHTSPGYICSKFSVVFAWNLYPSTLAGDEPEPIEKVSWPLAQIDELFERPDVNDARSIAALLRAKHWFAEHQQQVKFEGDNNE